MDAVIFLKGTRICYIAVSAAVGKGVGVWPGFLRGGRDEVPLDHQAVCLRTCMCLRPPNPRYVFQRLNDYSAPWCKRANNTLKLSFVANIYEN